MPTHDAHGGNQPEPDDWSKQAESDDFMTLHQGSSPESRKAGYELVDVNVKDTAIFLVVMAASICMVFVLAFGIGKLLYLELGRQDGPTGKWSMLAGAKRENMESNPAMEQQQLKQMVARFPAPRVQTDDGDADVADMHAREDMLLNYYTWADQQKQSVRIPISRAMELLAQRGLPVESQQTASAKPNQSAGESAGQAAGQAADKPMFGDASDAITAPITDGFARTGPELAEIYAREQRLERGTQATTQAELHSGR
jgi:hypothetical protein